MRRENEARNCAVGESGAGRGRRVMREGRQMQDLFIGVSCLAWYGAVTGEKKCISRCPLRTDRRTDRQRQTTTCTLHIVLPRSPRLGPWQPPPTAPEHQYPFLTASFSDLPTPPERPWKPQVMCAAPWRRRRRYGVRTQQTQSRCERAQREAQLFFLSLSLPLYFSFSFRDNNWYSAVCEWLG